MKLFSASPRCQVVPLPDQQVAIGIGGRERLRWHAGDDSPRPFFFPLIGPSGLPLTRMGHPGAPNHDHHRSIWFAHHKVLGIDFWGDRSEARIRQHAWLAYDDGEEDARLAVSLRWYDGHDPQPLLEQEVIAAVIPQEDEQLEFELQTTLKPVAESLELQQTHFGLLAVRMAKALSVAFGSGVLTGANGKQGEPQLFGKASPWIDYSGEIEPGTVEGITYFDHPSNVSYPSKWHVRSDGWMGASICRDQPVTLRREAPLTLRYLLYAHRGAVAMGPTGHRAAAFADRPPLAVTPSRQPHRTAAIVRV